MFLEDDKPKKTPDHEVGMDLSALSVNELKARIALLKAEIERLEADIRSKASTRDAAEGLFSRS